MPDKDESGTQTIEKVELGVLQKQVADARHEAANYRNQRNVALRTSHAFETILGAHNIDVSVVNGEALHTLPISNGEVDGKFAYTIPKPGNQGSEAAGSRLGGEKQSASLTLEDVEKMSHDEINKRWDEISPLLEK